MSIQIPPGTIQILSARVVNIPSSQGGGLGVEVTWGHNVPELLYASYGFWAEFNAPPHKLDGTPWGGPYNSHIEIGIPAVNTLVTITVVILSAYQLAQALAAGAAGNPAGLKPDQLFNFGCVIQTYYTGWNYGPSSNAVYTEPVTATGAPEFQNFLIDEYVKV